MHHPRPPTGAVGLSVLSLAATTLGVDAALLVKRQHGGARKQVPVAEPSECFPCDLRDLYVPSEVSWASPNDTGFIQEDTLEGSVKDYWAQIDLVAKTRNSPRSKPLHEQCKMEGGLNHFVAESWRRKRESPEEGGGMKKAFFHKGLFLVFHGDSFMRISMISMVRTMTRDPVVLQKAHYNRTTFHSGHLFCCSGHTGHGSDTEFTGCDLEFQGFDFPEDQVRQHIRRKVKQGQMCLLFQFRTRWCYEHYYLHNWLMGSDKNFSDAVPPDMVVLNGGLHYHDWGPNQTYYEQFDMAMTEYKEQMSTWRGERTSLVIASSTYNSFYDWAPQVAAYEYTRRAIKKMQPESIKSRVSYVDLHSMAGVDSCGFSHKFPAREYWATEQDQCGNNYTNSDIHPDGGVFLHFAEIVGFTLFQNKRRCDPTRYRPVDQVLWNPDTEEARRMQSYIDWHMAPGPKPTNWTPAEAGQLLKPAHFTGADQAEDASEAEGTSPKLGRPTDRRIQRDVRPHLGGGNRKELRRILAGSVPGERGEDELEGVADEAMRRALREYMDPDPYKRARRQG